MKVNILGAILVVFIMFIAAVVMMIVYFPESTGSSSLHLRSVIRNEVISPNHVDVVRLNSTFQTIRCHDGGMGTLNDNFCDCETGEDETTTEACSFWLPGKALFDCSYGNANSKKIFLSRVHDGVKDCPDGSDEH